MTTMTSPQVRWTMCRQRLPRRRSLPLDHLLFGVIGLNPPGSVCIGSSGFYKMACVFGLFRFPLEWIERLIVNPPLLFSRGEYVLCFSWGAGNDSKGLDYSAGRK